MTKKNQNITDYYSGDTLQIKVTVKDESGTAVDITGASITWKLFNSSDTEVLSKTTSGGGVSITDASNGKFRVDIAPADTESLQGSDFTHECQVTDSSGNVSTVFVGSFEILEDKIL